MPVCGESGKYMDSCFICTPGTFPVVIPSTVYDDHRELDAILAKLRPLFRTDASLAGTHPHKNDSFALSGFCRHLLKMADIRRCNRCSNRFANFGARSGRAAMSAHTSTGQARALSVRLSFEQHSKIKRVISKPYSTVRCSLRRGRAFVSRWFVYIATCNPTALIRLIGVIDLVKHY